MPLYNIIGKKWKPSQRVVQKVEDGKGLRTVLPSISRKLGIPSMKNYVAFLCDENKLPIGRLDMDIPLEVQGMAPLSFIYVAPIDSTPKGADGEELPLAYELVRLTSSKAAESDMDVPPPPPLEDEEHVLASNNANRSDDAKSTIDEETQKRSEEEARRRSEEEARRRSEEEAQKQREEEARGRSEEEARRRSEEEARRRSEEEDRRRSEEEARKRSEEETRKRFEEEARRRSEEEARRRSEEEARKRSEEETRKRFEEEARRRSEEEARRRSEEETRKRFEEEARRRNEEEARRRSEEEARRRSEEEAQKRSEEEARRRSEEEAQKQREEEAQKQREEEARRRSEEETRKRFEEEARRRSEEEAHKRVDDAVRRTADAVAYRKAVQRVRVDAEESIAKMCEDQSKRRAVNELKVLQSKTHEMLMQRGIELEADYSTVADCERMLEKSATKTITEGITSPGQLLPIDNESVPANGIQQKCTGSRSRVQLNLNPSVISSALWPTSPDFQLESPYPEPGAVARALASVAIDHSVHHAVLLRLADLLVRNRPSRPHQFMWLHLMSKIGEPALFERSAERISRRRVGAIPTFEPVGNTTEERLVSGVPPGPLRVFVSKWARHVLESKPSNPIHFMWLKLGSKLTREGTAVSLAGTSRLASPLKFDDPTIIALLLKVPRCTPIYPVLQNLLDLLFEKKPDSPEKWLYLHLFHQAKSGAGLCARSPGVLSRSNGLCNGMDGEASENGNYASRVEENEETYTERNVRRFLAALSRNQHLPSTLPPPTISPRRAVKSASTQTDPVRPVPQRSPPRRLVSPAPVSLHTEELSPRELLREPYAEEMFPSHLFALAHARRRRWHWRRRGRRGQRSAAHSLSPPPRGHSPSCREAGAGQSLSPSEPRDAPAAELWHAARRLEAQRAEAGYEYTWLMQREALRRERLQGEVETLRREQELRERVARRDPKSPRAAQAAAEAARALTESEAQLAALRQETAALEELARRPLERYDCEPPSELNILRKRLELLAMEEARSRHLAHSAPEANQWLASSLLPSRALNSDAAWSAEGKSTTIHLVSDDLGRPQDKKTDKGVTFSLM